MSASHYWLYLPHSICLRPRNENDGVVAQLENSDDTRMVYRFQQLLGIRLLGWSAACIAVGVVLFATTHGFLQGLALQAAIWGTIDGVIGWLGFSGGRRSAAMSHGAVQKEQDRKRLFKILRLNTIIDPFYVTAGILIAAVWGRKDAFVLGTGWGIIIQGSFLFCFDLAHTLAAQVLTPIDPADRVDAPRTTE